MSGGEGGPTPAHRGAARSQQLRSSAAHQFHHPTDRPCTIRACTNPSHHPASQPTSRPLMPARAFSSRSFPHSFSYDCVRACARAYTCVHKWVRVSACAYERAWGGGPRWCSYVPAPRRRLSLAQLCCLWSCSLRSAASRTHLRHWRLHGRRHRGARDQRLRAARIEMHQRASSGEHLLAKTRRA